jgi:hypothetical protein
MNFQMIVQLVNVLLSDKIRIGLIIIKMSEIISDLVTPIAVSSEEMTYSNKVYLSPLGKIPNHKRFIKLKGYVLSTVFS